MRRSLRSSAAIGAHEEIHLACARVQSMKSFAAHKSGFMACHPQRMLRYHTRSGSSAHSGVWCTRATSLSGASFSVTKCSGE